jgi:hypothetical protein
MGWRLASQRGHIYKWDGAMQVAQTDFEMGWRLASQRGHIYKWDGAMQVI